ncbi:MAG: CAP domain-containing protein [Parvularculaceae bacterium]
MRILAVVAAALGAGAGSAAAQSNGRLSATAPPQASLSAPSFASGDADGVTQTILAAINDIRRAQGLEELKLDQSLMQAAARYAGDLVHREELSHAGADGSAPPDRAVAAGYPGRYVAENLAAGYDDAVLMVNDWMASPSHRATILLDRASDLGVGLAVDPSSEYRTFWTLLIASPTIGVRS